jgi:hypothetical protein
MGERWPRGKVVIVLHQHNTPCRAAALALEEGTMMMLLSMALPQGLNEGLENLLEIVGKGDNMPIAGLIPIIAFFTWLSLSEAFRHDRLIAQGRQEEILDEMYK